MSRQTPKGRANGPSAKRLSELRIAPLGDYHPADRCAWCGLLSSESELVELTMLLTHARGLQCVDRIACLRRRRGAE
jgi:hypothetical protein